MFLPHSFLLRQALENTIAPLPITVAPDMLVTEAIALLNSSSGNFEAKMAADGCTGCLAVVSENQLVGLFSERTVTGLVASGRSLAGVTLAEVIELPIITLRQSELTNPEIALNLLRQHQIQHLPILDDNGQLLGLLTYESLCRLLQPVELGQPDEALIAALKLQTERSQLLMAVSTRIRASLSLSEILDATVSEVRQFLGCDRVSIYHFLDNGQFQVVAESLAAGQRSFVSEAIHDPCFAPDWADQYGKGRVRVVSDIYTAEMTPCHVELLERLQVRAKVLVPIIVNNQFWGLVSASESAVPRDWQPAEVTFLEQLGIQVAIAIQHSETATRFQQQRQELTALLDRAPDVIFRLDRDLHYLYLNAAVEIELGYAPAALIGQPLLAATPAPEHLAQWQTVTGRVAATGQEETIEYQLCTNSRSIWFQTRVVPEYDRDGTVTSFLCVARNITNKKQTEAKQAAYINVLLEWQNRHHAAQLATRQVLYEWDATSDRLMWGINADRLFGYSASKMPQTSADWFARIHPEDKEQVQTATTEYLEHQGHLCLQYRWWHQDGHYIWIEDQAQFFADANDNFTRIIGYITDISERKQLETALKESEAQLRQIFDNSQDVFFLKSIDGKEMIYTSPAWENLYQTPLQQAYDNPQAWLDFIHPDDRDRVVTFNQQACQGEKIDSLGYRIVRPDGSIRWLWNRTFPIRNEAGEIYRLAGVNIDITEQKQLELELNAAKERYQLAIRGIGEGVWDWDIVSDRIIASDRYWEILGYPLPAENASKFAYEVLREEIHPDDRYVMQAAIRRHLEDHLPYEVEFRRRKQSGEYLWCRSRGEAIRDAIGKPIRMVGAIADITERKQAEAELRQQEEFLRSIYTGAELAIFVIEVSIDEEFRYLEFNPVAERYGSVTSEEIQGKTPEEAFGEAVGSAIRQKYDLCLKSGQKIGYEEYLPFPTGSIWTLTKLFTIRSEAGNIHRIIGTAIDITDRKQAEADLRASEQTLSQVMNALPGAVFKYRRSADAADGFVFMSQGIVDLYEYTAEEILNNGPIAWDIVLPEDVEQMSAASDQSAATLEPWEMEFRIRTPSGVLKWMLGHSIPSQEEDGSIVWCGILTDISDRKQAELERQRSEALLQAFIAASPVGLTLFDRELRYLYGNEALAKINNLPLSEHLGRTLWEVVPEMASQFAPMLLQVMETQVPILNMEFSGEVSPGVFCSAISNHYPVCLPNGEVIGVGVSVMDVTELVQAQQELRKSEQNLRQLTNMVPGTVYKYRRLPGGSEGFIFLSKGIVDLYEYTPEEILNDIQIVWDIILPEDIEQIAASIDRSAATLEAWEIEFRIKTPSGILKWISGHSIPSQEEDGSIIWFGIFTDISDRKQAELDLQASEQRYLNLAELSPVGIFHTDPSGEFNYVNSRWCQLAGLSFQEAMGMGWTRALHPEDHHWVFLNWQRAIQSQTPFLMEYRFQRPDGRVYWLIGLAIAETDTTGKLTGYIGTVTDITDRKNSEQALQESEARLNDVLNSAGASIGHFRYYPNGVWETEYHSRGSERIFGYKSEEFLAELWLSGIVPEDWAIMQEPMLAAIKAEIETTLEYRFHHRDGSTRWVLDTLTSRWNESDGCWVVTAIGTDDSDRKHAELALQELNQELEARIARRTAALSESELRYRSLFEQAAVGISQCQPSGRYIQVNQRFCELTGYTQSELLDMSWQDLIYLEDLEVNRGELAHLHNGELASITTEIRYIRKDRRLQWVSLTVSMMYNAAGTIVGDLAVVEDISDRKQIEQQLQNSEKRLKEIISKTVDGILILNSQGQILFSNPAADRIFNCQKPDYQGADLGIPITLQKTFELEIPHLTTGITTVEIRVEEITWQDNKAFLAAIRDISDRKQTEIELQASELSYRTLAENLPGIVYKQYPSQNNTFIFFNNRLTKLFQLEPLDIDTQGTLCPVNSLIVPEDRDRVIEAIQGAIANQQPFQVEYCIHIPTTQEKRYLLEQGSTVTDNIGQALHIVGIIFDVTEIKQTEEKLRKINERLTIANAELARATRLKDEFLANMSHELRTPLNSILGLSEVLQERTYGHLTEQQHHALTTIQTNGRHLLELINDILDLAKIESGKLDLQMTPVSVQQLCRNTIPFVQQQAFKKQISFTLEVSPNLAYIELDERLIRQVLINLLTNAVKFTPNGGAVILKVQGNAAEQTMSFSAIDTGIGIAPENIDKLFQPFIQIDSNLSRRYAGTGLGLALVRRIIELHKGSVTVRSTLGQGSEFTVVLPWKNVNPPNSDKALDNTATVAPIASQFLPVETKNTADNIAEKPVVLLVDDNLDNIETLQAYLELKGFNIVVARNGLQAIHLTQAQSFNLILMDIQMPDMNGLEAIRQIRSQEQDKRIPILAVTALAMSGDKEQCLTAGANDYLTKPISPIHLVNVMKKYLQLSQYCSVKKK